MPQPDSRRAQLDQTTETIPLGRALMTLTQQEHAYSRHSARPGRGWARSSAGGACRSSRLECPAAYPSSSAPSTARSVIASVEVDVPADLPHNKPISPTDGRAIGAGWARSRAGGACQSSRFECPAADPSMSSPSASRSTVTVSSVPDDGASSLHHGHGYPICCTRLVAATP